jgi:hypothetical protein
LEPSTSDYTQNDDSADEEKIIPWAEGNGLWQALSQMVNDLTSCDVVTFFVQNPFTCDTADSLAMRIGRQSHQVEPVLERLVELRLLAKSSVGCYCVYEMTKDTHRRQTAQQYVLWLGEGYHWTRMVLDS